VVADRQPRSAARNPAFRRHRGLPVRRKSGGHRTRL